MKRGPSKTIKTVRSAKKSSAAKGGRRFSAKRASGSGRALVLKPPPGFTQSPTSRLLTPALAREPVKPTKLRQGIAEAKRQLDETLDEIVRTMTGDYKIKEIKLVASFSADGKFMGFGVGGAASMEITICPSDD